MHGGYFLFNTFYVVCGLFGFSNIEERHLSFSWSPSFRTISHHSVRWVFALPRRSLSLRNGHGRGIFAGARLRRLSKWMDGDEISYQILLY